MPFEALLSRMAPKGDAGATAAGRMRPGWFEIRGTERGRLAAVGPEGTDPQAEVLALDVASQAQGLAQGVAERIAAALDGGQARGAPAGTAPDGLPQRAGARRDGVVMADVMAASLARRADANSGAASGKGASPAFSVTHRETVFAAPSLPGVQAAGGPAVSAGGTNPSSPTPEPGEIRHGRAEQLMLGDRAVPGRGAIAPARTPEGVPGAMLRAAPEETKQGAAPQQAGGEAAHGESHDGAALGLPGAADQRGAGAASSGAVPAAQPAAAPPALPVVPGAVKVLHIQLHPVELGVLEVRMRMTDGGLEVQIEASRPETAALLKSDRDTLESVLRGTGHALDAVSVSITEKSGDASGQPPREGWHGPASDQRGEAQAGLSRGQAGEQAREQGGRWDDRPHSRPNGQANEKVHDDQNHSAAAVRPRGGLYL
jgi:chemotaxis protein MotD